MTTQSDTNFYGKKLQQDQEAIQQKTGKTPEELYEEREKRLREAIQLKEPDRVPWVLLGGDSHLPPSAAYYNPASHREALIRAVLNAQPDIHAATPAATSGLALELLDPKHMKWPGGNLPENISWQAIEQEYMKADEYKLFLADPTDYTLRYLLPRAFGALEPLLGKMPHLSDRFTGFTSLTPFLASQDFQKVFQIILKAGKEQEKNNRIMGNISEELARLGFPSLSHGGGVGGAPFDAISDYHRGMRGAMLDMYRQPDKLLAACDKILELRTLRAAPADPKKRGNPKRTYIPLHRGAEGFMSRKQFETFYWPGLKKVMLTNIDFGFVPILSCQGKYDDRLEYLLELPKGKVVAYLHQSDPFRAKEILGGHVCIMASVPPSLAWGGSVQEVEEYRQKLLRVCGKGGGFILVSSLPINS